MPPTPTPLPPPGPPLITLPSGYNIWNFADEAIMIWNTAGSSRTQVIQIAIIVIIVVAAVVLLTRYVRSIMEEE
jgi:hypothetical protein